MRTFLIEKDKWICGLGAGVSRLVTGPEAEYPDMSCCLGFASEQIGVDRALLVGEGGPACAVERDIESHLIDEFVRLDLVYSLGYYHSKKYENTSLSCQLMRVNDSENGISKDERLDAINASCERFGANFRFAFTSNEAVG